MLTVNTSHITFSRQRCHQYEWEPVLLTPFRNAIKKVGEKTFKLLNALLFLSRFCQRKSSSKGSNSVSQSLYIIISANHLVILLLSQAGNVLVFRHFLFLFRCLIFMFFWYFPYTISLFCSNPFSFFISLLRIAFYTTEWMYSS